MKFLQKIGYITLALLMILCISNSVNAASTVSSSTIPETMMPYTEIEFISNDTYKILKGGISTETNTQKSLLERSSFQEANKLEAECQSNGTAATAIHEDYPTPQKGMTIIYGSDGLLTKILDKTGKEFIDNNSTLNSVNNNLNSRVAASKVKIASWGANNNRLYRKTMSNGTKKIIGYGRATTFNDKVGQRDHTLVKGDIATKMAYDNCKFGLEVKVKANKKVTSTKVSHNMKKCDVGGMPNAIVDIWKTGVSYWGYTYSSNLSLSGEVRIIHANQY